MMGSTAACGIDYFTLSQSSFDCDDIGNNTVTLTVYDNNGNSDNCTATVTVTGSNNPPVAVCQDITVDLGSGNSSTITANDIDNGSSADCESNSISIDQTTFNCADMALILLH